MTASFPKPIGLLGGTFDPIHHGHLRLAVELYERLDLAQVRLIPSAHPPHRQQPMVDGRLRLAMVKAAIINVPGLIADGRELSRTGPSYTVDTLYSFRDEHPHTPFFLILGMDAFMNLNRWHHWEKITTLAHILVVKRPGTLLPMNHAMHNFMLKHRVNPENITTLAGKVVVQEIPAMTISSTQIRALLASQRNPHYLLPLSVLDLIEQHQLYR